MSVSLGRLVTWVAGGFSMFRGMKQQLCERLIAHGGGKLNNKVRLGDGVTW
jgi:hypothetical protein